MPRGRPPDDRDAVRRRTAHLTSPAHRARRAPQLARRARVIWPAPTADRRPASPSACTCLRPRSASGAPDSWPSGSAAWPTNRGTASVSRGTSSAGAVVSPNCDSGYATWCCRRHPTRPPASSASLCARSRPRSSRIPCLRRDQARVRRRLPPSSARRRPNMAAVHCCVPLWYTSH